MRETLVDEKMIELWATRYMAIKKAHGAPAATEWSGGFLNPEDYKRVTAAIRDGRYVA